MSVRLVRRVTVGVAEAVRRIGVERRIAAARPIAGLRVMGALQVMVMDGGVRAAVVLPVVRASLPNPVSLANRPVPKATLQAVMRLALRPP